MADRVMLTDQREKVLNGEYDGSDAALRKQKSRLRQSAQTTLDELTEIAQSPHIDTREVFEPDQIFLLLRAILTPDEYTGPVYPPTESAEHATEEAKEWVNYHNQLYVQLDKLLADYRDRTVPTDE